MMRNTPLTIAMHEAGHAVAMLANPPHPYIASVSVNGLADDILGLVDVRAMWQPWMLDAGADDDAVELMRGLASKDAIFFLAGPIAELRWRGHSRAAIWFGAPQFADQCLGQHAPPSDTDLGRVRTRLAWAYPGSERECFNTAWLEAEAIVAKHWRSIQAIGRTLAERKYIEGDELDDLWRKVGLRSAPGTFFAP